MKKEKITIYEIMVSTETAYTILFFSLNKPSKEDIINNDRFISFKYEIKDIIVRKYNVSIYDIANYMNLTDNYVEEYTITF